MLQEHPFGYWLKRSRKALDLTQTALAKKVGCSADTIRKLEAEERRPSAQIAERLAEVLHISEDERAEFLRFARGDWHSTSVAIKDDVPWKVPEKSSHSNLPATTTSLVGRQKEIAFLHGYVQNNEIRLVTLIGSPGIGKTRLSIEAARTVVPHFQDGVFFVSLAPLEDPTHIAMKIAQTVGFIQVRNVSPEELLKEGIGDKHMLIVLDNCEHLIEKAASLTSDLLSACSRLKIVATSREALRISGEWLYPVPALDVPAFDAPGETSLVNIETVSDFPALMLFAERARAVRPDFMLDSKHIQTVATICTHLDGLPLAIELIASRIRVMSPQALLARLNDQFILSVDGMRSASARQKTLQNAITWSYNLLSVEEQRLFVLLSVFSGGFMLEAAEAMFSRSISEKSVTDSVTSLLDKSLLQRTSTTHDEPHFNMLVTIQQFALNQLRSMDGETDARHQHLVYFLDLAEQADKEIRGPNQLPWLQRLEMMRDNLRAALDWAIETGKTKVALELARKLHWFWFVQGDHTEGQQWLARVLEMRDVSAHPKEQAEALTQLANHIVLKTGDNQAQPFVEQALLIARAHKDKHNSAKALVILGLISKYEKNFTKAQAILRESQQLFQNVHDEWGYANATMALGSTFWEDEDWATALLLSQEAFAGFQKLGDRYFQSVTLRHIGFTSVNLGDLANGMAALRESLLLAQQLHSKYEIGWTLWRFAEAARRMDNFVRAARLYEAARRIFEYIGTWWHEDKIELEKILAACHVELGEAELITAIEQGRAMTMEQAIAYALEESS
jgi:predicted ATPase/transcriptional regulator with XRE-family HTH domain